MTKNYSVAIHLLNGIKPNAKLMSRLEKSLEVQGFPYICVCEAATFTGYILYYNQNHQKLTKPAATKIIAYFQNIKNYKAEFNNKVLCKQ